MIGEQINVHGIAIRPGISKNRINYTAEELNLFAPTLKNKPILKDHESRTDNTIGLVEKSESNGKGVVDYEGWIKEDGSGILERIHDRRIKEVSIGAFVEKLVKENDDDDFVTAIGIKAMELSTTPTPGVKGTSLQQSLESIEKKKAGEKVTVLPILEDCNTFKEIDIPTKIVENKKVNKEEIRMVEETIDKAKLEEDLRKKLTQERADLETKETVLREKIEKEMREKIEKETREKIVIETKEKVESEKVAAKVAEEQKAKLKEEVKKELLEDLDKVKDVLKEMKGKTEEEIKKALKEKGISDDLVKGLKFETKKPLHGKVTTKTTEAQTEVADSYVVENSEFGAGLAYYRQPNADGTYGKEVE